MNLKVTYEKESSQSSDENNTEFSPTPYKNPGKEEAFKDISRLNVGGGTIMWLKLANTSALRI